MNARFYDALTAETACNSGAFTIYGFKLVPLSLWHSVVLYQLENPAWIGGDCTPVDLLVAASICSTTDRIALPDPQLAVETMATFDFESQYAGWEKYCKICHAVPATKTMGGDGDGSLKAPVELLVATYLMRELGMDERRVWTMPAGLAFWYFEAAREQESGRSLLITDEEAREMDAAETEEGMKAAEDGKKRMVILLRKRNRRLQRARTDAAKRKVQEWFTEQLRYFDAGV